MTKICDTVPSAVKFCEPLLAGIPDSRSGGGGIEPLLGRVLGKGGWQVTAKEQTCNAVFFFFFFALTQAFLVTAWAFHLSLSPPIHFTCASELLVLMKNSHVTAGSQTSFSAISFGP